MEKTAAALICMFLAIPSLGAIIIVDDDGPADFNNIQAAIDTANNGDTIEIQPGTYTGPGNRDIEFRGKAITVRSIDPCDPAVVDGTTIGMGLLPGRRRYRLFRRPCNNQSLQDTP